MSDNQSHEAKRFQLLSSVGQIGWWEADFATGEYLCSEYVCNLFGLEDNTMTFHLSSHQLHNHTSSYLHKRAFYNRLL